jgi:tape measure domain-containing protein
MATENLKVKVTVDSKQAESALNTLRGAVSGLLGAIVGREFVQFADSITSLQNKLRSISPSLQNAQAQFDAIAKIAIASRAPLAETGDLYFRIARNADALGISQLEAATITDSLAKAMATTGLSAAEAAGPLLQLGQALQSGRFQGDELRSILEGMPIVAQAMADSLGVTIGQLRELGSQGKLTGDVFVAAMQQARQGILDAFGNTIPTISQAFTVLGNAGKIAFNEFEKNSQTGQKFALAIEYLAFQVYKASKNMDEFIQPIAKVVKFLAILLTFTIVGRIIRAIGVAFTAVTSTASGLATAGTTLVAAFRTMMATGKTLGRTIQITASSFFTFFKRIASGFPFMEAMKRLIIALGNRLGYLKPVVAAVASFFGKLGAAIAYVAGAIASFVGVDQIIAEFNSFGDAASDNNEELAAFREEMANFGTGLSDVAGSGTALAASQAEIAEKVGAARREIELSAEAYHRNVAAMKEQIQFQRDQIGLSDEQIKVNEALRDFNKSYADEEIRMQDEITKLRAKGGQASDEERGQMAELQVQLERLRGSRAADLAAIRAGTAALFEETRAFEVNREARQTIMDVGAQGQEFRTRLQQQEQLNQAENELVRQRLQMQFDMEKANLDAMLALRKKYAGQDIPAVELAALEQIRAVRQAEFDLNQQYLQADFDSRRTFAAGWAEAAQQAVNRITETVADQGAYAKRIFDTITSGFSNSIMKFVETGKLSFKDLFKTLMAEIIKMQMNKLFLSIFGKGGPAGSLFAGLFAEGGRIPSGKYGIVGERGPELVRGPANVTSARDTAAMMGGGITQVTYNINAVDSMSFKQMVARDPEFIYSVTQMGARRLPR